MKYRFEQPTIEHIRKEFESKGAELLTKEYLNNTQVLEFLCSKCGRKYHIRWNNYKNGRNPNLLCDYCKPHGKIQIEDIRREFELRGSTLLSENYVNNRVPLIFSCSVCSTPYKISWANFSRGRNTTLLCKECLSQKKHFIFEKYQKIYNAILNSRGTIGRDFLLYSLEFWNIKGGYVAHHIQGFAEYPDLATSLSNIYPLRSHIHIDSFIDPISKVQNPFHSVHPRKVNSENWYSSILNYPDYVKLPYHNYADFNFIDLTKYFVSEIYDENIVDIDEYLYVKELYYKERNILFFPIRQKDFRNSSFRREWMLNIKYKLSTETSIGPKIYDYTGGI